MAFELRIVGFLKADRERSESAVTLSASWWDRRALMKDPRFAKSLSDDLYQDYDAYLSVEETIELHETFLPRATSGIYTGPLWQEIVQRELTQLRNVLFLRGGEFDGFHIELREWESGLG